MSLAPFLFLAFALPVQQESKAKKIPGGSSHEYRGIAFDLPKNWQAKADGEGMFLAPDGADANSEMYLFVHDPAVRSLEGGDLERSIDEWVTSKAPGAKRQGFVEKVRFGDLEGRKLRHHAENREGKTVEFRFYAALGSSSVCILVLLGKPEVFAKRDTDLAAILGSMMKAGGKSTPIPSGKVYQRGRSKIELPARWKPQGFNRQPGIITVSFLAGADPESSPNTMLELYTKISAADAKAVMADPASVARNLVQRLGLTEVETGPARQGKTKRGAATISVTLSTATSKGELKGYFAFTHSGEKAVLLTALTLAKDFPEVERECEAGLASVDFQAEPSEHIDARQIAGKWTRTNEWSKWSYYQQGSNQSGTTSAEGQTWVTYTAAGEFEEQYLGYVSVPGQGVTEINRTSRGTYRLEGNLLTRTWQEENGETKEEEGELHLEADGSLAVDGQIWRKS